MKAFKQFTLSFFIALCVIVLFIFQPTEQDRADNLERIKKENARYSQQKYNDSRAREDREAWENVIREAKYQESLKNR